MVVAAGVVTPPPEMRMIATIEPLAVRLMLVVRVAARVVAATSY